MNRHDADSSIDHHTAATTEARVEELEDAIRDMLDFTVGWCHPMTDAEKLEAVRAAGEKVLA